MTLIEGIGDEVVQFAGVVVVFIVGALAWWSTNANPDRYRTVLVMRSRPHHPVTVSIRTRSNMVLTSTQSSSTTVSTAASTSSASIPSPPNTTEEAPQEGERVIPLQEMDSIVDADMAMLDNNRLHFYRRMDSPNNSQVSTVESPEPAAEAEPASTAQMREMDSIVSAMEADVTTGCDFFTRPSESSSHNATVSKKKLKVKKGSLEINQKSEDNETASAEPEVSNVEEMAAGDQTDNNVDETSKILIKLKYLNDTLKEVEGSLDELLKDFKRRHFSLELSAESVVRLIFHGRVLDEASTLRACGLHHRAVVHALVHPRRAGQTRGTPEETPLSPTHELVTEGAPPERAWDLENILMTLVSVALTVVWFFRCEYSNMFTASASVALFGLTVFYSVAIFGLYLSDTFHFDRRPAQPVPNN